MKDQKNIFKTVAIIVLGIIIFLLIILPPYGDEVPLSAAFAGLIGSV